MAYNGISKAAATRINSARKTAASVANRGTTRMSNAEAAMFL